MKDKKKNKAQVALRDRELSPSVVQKVASKIDGSSLKNSRVLNLLDKLQTKLAIRVIFILFIFYHINYDLI